MRLSFVLPNMGSLAVPGSVAAVAQTAEELGYDGLWVGERSLYPLDPKAPYPAGSGVLPEVFKTNLDPLDTLSFVAGQTSRIAVGTSVLNLPWYSPVLLARRLTTLDVLSNGRLRVGLGFGWSPDEYEAAGVPWPRRASRGMEALRVLKAIWTSDPVEFDGEFYRVPRSNIGPKPVQQPHPPIYVGAFGQRALEWAAQESDGWIAGGMPFEVTSQIFAGVRAAAQAAGRDPAKLELVMAEQVHLSDRPGDDRAPFTGTPEQFAADVVAAREMGAAELVFNLVATDNPVRSLDDLLNLMVQLYELAQVSAPSARP